MKRINKEIIRDQKLRLKYLKNEYKNIFYKSLVSNRFLNIELRTGVYLKRLKLKSTNINIKNRCILTGRGRSIMRKFKISRIMFRNLVTNGLIIGIKKNN